MKDSLRVVVGIVVVLLAVGAFAQEPGASTRQHAAVASPATPQEGKVVVPESSIERPGDAGLRAHTNVVLKSLDGKTPLLVMGPKGVNPDITVIDELETPASLGCLYVSSPKSPKTGCAPKFEQNAGGPTAAGWGAIALVDAYDNPYASNDLAEFTSYLGLPAASFTKIEMSNSCTAPPADPGWSLEESLDIEWAHVYAPNAAIILVEACSNSLSDLVAAESEAIAYIQYYYGGGEVSDSWGAAEFSGENAYDPDFAGFSEYYYVPVTTFASAGDSGCGAAYPSSSPWVVSAGGTTVIRNKANGKFVSESCWGGSGGGTSAYETWANSYTGSNTGPWADFQYQIFGEGNRATPDLAHDADPNSGVVIDALYYGVYYGYCAAEPCFWKVGGTSVASPSLAGIANRLGNKLSTWFGNSVDSYGFYHAGENNYLYSQLETATAYYTNFYDITTGSNGCTVTDHWDYCTGVGSPRGTVGK